MDLLKGIRNLSEKALEKYLNAIFKHGGVNDDPKNIIDKLTYLGDWYEFENDALKFRIMPDEVYHDINMSLDTNLVAERYEHSWQYDCHDKWLGKAIYHVEIIEWK